MPIKAENKRRYPADWTEVRERILKRAGWRCEHPGCTAQQYAVGEWISWGGGPPEWRQIEGDHFTWSGARKRAQWLADHGYGGGRPIIAIVLTVAHLDHRPENCDDSNLRALCQRHHLAHDHQHHMANAQATRRARSGNLELFA